MSDTRIYNIYNFFENRQTIKRKRIKFCIGSLIGVNTLINPEDYYYDEIKIGIDHELVDNIIIITNNDGNKIEYDEDIDDEIIKIDNSDVKFKRLKLQKGQFERYCGIFIIINLKYWEDTNSEQYNKIINSYVKIVFSKTVHMSLPFGTKLKYDLTDPKNLPETRKIPIDLYWEIFKNIPKTQMDTD